MANKKIEGLDPAVEVVNAMQLETDIGGETANKITSTQVKTYIETGTAGGRQFSGGTAASENLVWDSTEDATKGDVKIASGTTLSSLSTNYETLVTDDDDFTNKKYVDDASNIVIQELLLITTPGQTAFTLSQAPGDPLASLLTLNGQVREYGVAADYSISGTSLTWNDPGGLTLKTADTFQIWYDLTFASFNGVWDDDDTDVTTNAGSRNVNLQSSGLKDTNVTTAVLLGDGSNTSFNTTNKTIIGAVNETFSAFNDLNKKSLLFDGVNDYVSIPTASDMEFERTDAFSFSFWFKPTTSATGRIYSKRSATGNAQGIEMLMLSNKLQVILSGDSSPVDRIYMETTSTFALGIWSHITITYDGSSDASGVKIYINNVSDTLTTLGNNLTLTIVETGNIYLATNRSINSFIAANIDNFAVFDTELSSANVTEIYNKRIISDYQNLTFNSDLIHWWKMGDFATSFTISDEIGSIDGTMTNMVGSAIVDDTP